MTNVVGANLEERSKRWPGFAEAVAVGTQSREIVRHPRCDAVGKRLHIICDGDINSTLIGKQLLKVRRLCIGKGMQSVVALTGFRFPVQLVITGDAPDRDGVTSRYQQVAGGNGLLHDRATGQQMNFLALCSSLSGALCRFRTRIQIGPGDNRLIQVFLCWHRRHDIIFVIGGNVIEDIFLQFIHSVDAFPHNHHQLKGEGRVIAL